MDLDVPFSEAFPFAPPPGGTSNSTGIETGPVLSKEERDLKELGAYFPTFQPGRPVNFTDLLGYGGETGVGTSGQFIEDPVGDQSRRRKIVDLDGEYGFVRCESRQAF